MHPGYVYRVRSHKVSDSVGTFHAVRYLKGLPDLWEPVRVFEGDLREPGTIVKAMGDAIQYADRLNGLT